MVALSLYPDVEKHFRIISKGSSEGFSPWFLLLGATSSAAGMLNMYEVAGHCGPSITDIPLEVDITVGYCQVLQEA